MGIVLLVSAFAAVTFDVPERLLARAPREPASSWERRTDPRVRDVVVEGRPAQMASGWVPLGVERAEAAARSICGDPTLSPSLLGDALEHAPEVESAALATTFGDGRAVACLAWSEPPTFRVIALTEARGGTQWSAAWLEGGHPAPGASEDASGVDSRRIPRPIGARRTLSFQDRTARSRLTAYALDGPAGDLLSDAEAMLARDGFRVSRGAGVLLADRRGASVFVALDDERGDLLVGEIGEAP